MGLTKAWNDWPPKGFVSTSLMFSTDLMDLKAKMELAKTAMDECADESQRQKFIVLVRVYEFILSDNVITDKELDFVQTPSTSDSGGSGSDQNNVGATN